MKKINESSSFLNLSILEISKTVMHGFWNDNVDTNRFIVYIKTEDIYVNIFKKIEIRFDT